MNPLLAAALEVQSFIQSKGWRSCIIGGLAVHRWGNPRATQDVDISLLTGFGSEERYIDDLLSTFTSRIADARSLAVQGRVVLMTASNGIPIDIALAGLSYEEGLMDRASPHEYASGVLLNTISAEDLIITKAFADRGQDWVDVEGIVAAQWSSLDWSLVEQELNALCALKEDNSPVRRLQEVRRRIAGQ